MLNSQCSIHPRGPAIANGNAMLDKIAFSDQPEDRLIDFAARMIHLAGCLPRTFQARHIASQILRSGTAGAPNYAEARGAESRADLFTSCASLEKSSMKPLYGYR